MNNIVAFIPARGGSKSIPRKNLKLLGKKPLIAYSIESALQVGLRVVVSTDDPEIAEVSRQYGAEVLERSKSLGQDKTSMFEVLRSEVPKVSSQGDLILLLQPTSPLRKSVHVKAAISYLSENLDKYDSLISVEKVPEKYSPYAMIVENGGKKMLVRRLKGIKEKIISLVTGKKFAGPSLSGYPISERLIRRQDFPQCWIPDGSIYLFKAENLKKGSIYGKETMLLETEGTININNLEDWEKAEELCKQA